MGAGVEDRFVSPSRMFSKYKRDAFCEILFTGQGGSPRFQLLPCVSRSTRQLDTYAALTQVEPHNSRMKF